MLHDKLNLWSCNMSDSLPKLPLITYNLKDRGRKFTGQERNFNIRAIMDSINGPSTQEKIKTRGMLGYFGHKMRVLAGLEPQESVVIGGKYNEIEPAIVTTYLEAFPDGTIKHQTEFLDTESGRKAARLYASKIGGFSSAIDEKRPEFYGFDYVLQPNYHHNRPYSLDSVAGLTFDSVLAEAIGEEEAGWLSIIGQKDAVIQQLQAALDSAVEENEQYASMLASGRYGPEATLDSADSGHLIVPVASAQQLQRDVNAFRTAAALPRFVDPQSKDPAFAEEYERMLGVIGHV
jgi:hypothetical protein